MVYLDKTKLPKHIAIIMDGNGRWASEHSMPRLYGHQKGRDALKRVIEVALEVGIPYLTVWAFSTENWRRPQDEVMGLMNLLRHTLQKNLAELHQQNIRLKVIGLRDRIPKDLQDLIDHAISLTAQNTALTLSVAFNYGGRADLTQAVQALAAKVQAGKMTPQEITEELISQHTLTHDLPDPDLIIRTGCVQRLSNFMMWQASYSELVFCNVNWPAFSKKDFMDAIEEYQKCDRKFGNITAA